MIKNKLQFSLVVALILSLLTLVYAKNSNDSDRVSEDINSLTQENQTIRVSEERKGRF